MSRVYPVGLSAGTYRPAGDGEQTFVRVGRRLYGVGTVDIELWTAAHLPPADPGAEWARGDVLAAYHRELVRRESTGEVGEPTAADLDDAVLGSAYGRLQSSGLLVEVADPADQLDGEDSGVSQREFAARHRFRGLLGGLGQALDDPGMEIVGTPTKAVAVIEQTVYGVWQLAGQAESVQVTAEQIVGEAAAVGDTLTVEECLARLLPDLGSLVRQGLGYFDEVPRNEGPVQYLAIEHAPLDLTTLKELREMTADRLLDETEYRSRLSGASDGLTYLVTDPTTGEDVGYAGFAGGALFDTIASLHNRTPESLVAQARLQLRAAGDYPLVWHVQQPDDVAAVRALLQQAGISQIEIRHTPSS